MIEDWWICRFAMRRVALLLCVLLLAPVTGAWSLPELPDTESEWVVVKEDGWAHVDWVALRSDGLEPLRQITATEMLVWGKQGSYQLEGKSVLRGQNADGYRVVLEPRLPSHAQWGIISMFDFEMLQLAGMNSALPTSFEIHGVNPDIFNSIPGVWWVEPLLETKARNDLSSSIMENSSMIGHPAWNLGLNGSGVIIGVADSGIELDHGCFRENSTTIGEIGAEHRKIVLVNTSIDDGDHSGQADYRHGTHIAGTLVCDMWNGTAGAGTSPSHGARVLFQDVVNESGWSEPTADWLLAEAFANGVVIHSDSWGDDTEAYTLRSAEFDLWHREVPWSLAFIAPGNNPNRFFEPANARNVVSVGGSLHDNSSDLYSSSSQGPTEEGLRGNFIVAPAVGIVSAAADGNLTSFNDDMRSSTGTSMSTPMGASITAVIQQMVQDGWFTEDGFVPSGPQLRALLALSADSMGGGAAPDAQQGWGRPNLANLLDYDTNSSANIWIHDSYMMNETNRSQLANEWLSANGSRPLEQVISSLWSGTNAQGPFLKQGENMSWNLTLVPGEDLDVFLSFNQRPFGAVSDDLNVAVILPNGTRISTNESLEGTEHVSVLASELVGLDNVTIEVSAELVGIGNYSDVLGSDGDMIGFSLAIRGVDGEIVAPEPEPVSEPEDGDNDGVPDDDDLCPVTPFWFTAVDEDGCIIIYDGDEDGIPDGEDGCPNTEFEYRDMVGYDGCIPEPEPEPKVLIIGIDGVRGDVAEMVAQENQGAFGKITEEGAWSFNANTGPLSNSGTGWSSMLTGVWCDRHGVRDNSWEGSNHTTVPNIFDIVESNDPNLRTAALYWWDPLGEHILSEDSIDILENFESDAAIRDRAIELLTTDSELDVLLVSIDNPDSIGHRYGFGPEIPEYVDGVEIASNMAMEIMGALDQRNLNGENWITIIASDHGGGGLYSRSHYPSHPDDQNSLLLVHGGDVVVGEMTNGPVVVDVVATALTHLEFDLPDGDSVLDGRASAFDSQAPTARSPSCEEPDDVQVQLRGLRELIYHPEFILGLGIGVSIVTLLILRKKQFTDEEE